MSGYIFHSEAYEDLDNILEFIANDSSDAADRLLDQFLEAMSNLARFPYRGSRTSGPDFAAFAILAGARIPDRLLAGVKSSSGCCNRARPPEPEDNRGHSSGP
jgi:plasmid stabilization system protein ParE